MGLSALQFRNWWPCCSYANATTITLEQVEYLQRQQDRTQRRYLVAIKSLATVRRLLSPTRLDVRLAATLEAGIAGAESSRGRRKIDSMTGESRREMPVLRNGQAAAT